LQGVDGGGASDIVDADGDIDLASGECVMRLPIDGEYYARHVGATLPEKHSGSWASSIRLVDVKPYSPSDAYKCLHSSRALELAKNEAAFSVASVCFHDQGDEQFLISFSTQTAAGQVAAAAALRMLWAAMEAEASSLSIRLPAMLSGS
jgi:hypothetical protein